jgi:hypothetical protein
MTAVVTDINEYRRKKEGKNIFASWTDDMVRARYKLLVAINEGWDELTDDSNPLVRASFPNGFDPVNHPGENLEAVAAEQLRREVSPA